jgi:hypothetical protein
MSYSAISVGNTATLIIAANTKRHSVVFSNEDTALVVYFGPDSSVTTANAPGLQPGCNFSEGSGATNVWKGNIYGIVTAGTADVRVWEREQA